MSRVLGVIPARYGSSRFPGKPLAPLGARTLIEEVWRRTARAHEVDDLVIATDDERIRDAAERFGARVMMTEASHPSGTDRVAEVVRRLAADGDEYEIVCNVQGDEALLTPSALDKLVQAMATEPRPRMATLAEPLDPTENEEELADPHVVKVVVAADGRALYFSRAPIPGLRHQGIYAFTASALLEFSDMKPSPLELRESLEQLRALEAGWSIRVVQSDFRSLGVDTPEDLRRVSRILTEVP